MIRLLIEFPTTGSNAREHTMARARRVKDERLALAAVWFAKVRLTGKVKDLLERATIRRPPRGLTADERAMVGTGFKVFDKVLRPRVPLLVKLTRISAGTLDEDNLRAALKGMRDEIAWQMGINDRDPLVKWDYDSPGQESGPAGYYAVRVEIEAREQALGIGT